MRRNRRNGAAFIKLLIVAVLFIAVYFFADTRMTPIVNTLALSRAQNLATVIINDTVAAMLSDNKNDFSGLIIEEYDGNGTLALFGLYVCA